MYIPYIDNCILLLLQQTAETDYPRGSLKVIVFTFYILFNTVSLFKPLVWDYECSVCALTYRNDPKFLDGQV